MRKVLTVTMMTSALYANTNLDAKENQGMREKLANEIAESAKAAFEESITIIYGAKSADDMPDMDDPFFAAMKLPPNEQ